jgi:oligoendopeptidase F
VTLIDVQEVAWDLDPLVDGDGPEGADRLLDEADERAARFAETYAGRVGELDGEGLSAAMAELETIVDRLGRAGSYAMLRFAVDTADPANGWPACRSAPRRWRRSCSSSSSSGPPSTTIASTSC